MSAPKENTFYKKRNKDGRDRLFSSPELLHESAIEYFKWCDENPWIRIDFKGKEANKVEIPTQRPYTLKGLCIFLGVGYNYFTQFKTSIKEKIKPGSLTYDPGADEFNDAILFIEQVIYTNKFEGAVVGVFNANIISRDLALVDKSSMNMNFDKMDEETLDQIIERLTNKSENE